MKLHHAAAITLVGWILLDPAPRHENYDGNVGKAADWVFRPFWGNQPLPMAEWMPLGSFDTEKQCQAAQIPAEQSVKHRLVCASADDLWPILFPCISKPGIPALSVPRCPQP